MEKSNNKSHKSSSAQAEKEISRLKKQIEMLEGIIAALPGHVYWVDRNNVYLGCNDNQAISAGFSSRHEIVGKRNADLHASLSGRNIPEELNQVNLQVMELGQTIILEEPAHHRNRPDQSTFLSHKVPLKNNKGIVIGMAGISFDITARKRQEQELQEAKEKAEAALRAKQLAEAESQQKSLDLQMVLKGMSQDKYYLSGKYQGVYLTRREAECLICLPRGLTSKQIAETLNISFRTVEQYLSHLRIKLHCKSRAALIQVAIECEFLEGIKPKIF
ncbi:MAG: putative sensory box sensor histidine kinase/response regulator [Gammaproteobacteria bacterium]|jgi:DNA-binding CsgD family transcriptional regulator|nr:putative sensory box sensor histidine kinase/response regulator [Gammaproteobacteria bacterium]